jgi:hypothetical protein
VVETPEPWIERVIRDAQAEGKLDVTKGAGQPIPGLARPYDAGWWARNWIATERARAETAELARAVEQALPRVLARETITDVRDGLELLNVKIVEHNEAKPDHKLPRLDVEHLIARRATRPR